MTIEHAFLSRWGRGGAYSCVACFSNLTMDHAPLSRRREHRSYIPNKEVSKPFAYQVPGTFFRYIIHKQYVYRIPFLFRWGGGFLWGLRTCNRSITATYCCFCRKKVGSTTDAPEVHMIRAAAAYYTFMAKGATGYTATRRVFYTSLSCIISTVCMITCNTNRACILG